MIIWTLFGTDRKDRLKVVVDGEEVNKLFVVNRLGHRVEGSVAELLHLLLKKTSFETLIYFFKKEKRTCTTSENASPSSVKIWVRISLSMWPVLSTSSAWGCHLRHITLEDLTSAHMQAHTNMHATHTSDLHKCPHSPGMRPRDPHAQLARTSPEGWSWWWFKELR